MPIDDALSELENKSNKPEENKEITINDFQTDMMKTYITAMAQTTDNFDNILKFTKFVKFNPDLSLKVLPIPKTSLLDSFNDSEELNYLLQNTDLADYISDFSLEDTSNKYDSFRIFKEQILGCENFEKLCELSKTNFIIPNFYFLSLFMENGEKFRKYLDVTKGRNVSYAGKERGVLSILFNNGKACANTNNFFTVSFLKKYAEETKIKEITDMIKESNFLFSQINQWQFIRNNNLEVIRVRKELYSRLQKYSSSLIYNPPGSTNPEGEQSLSDGYLDEDIPF